MMLKMESCLSMVETTSSSLEIVMAVGDDFNEIVFSFFRDKTPESRAKLCTDMDLSADET